MRTRPADVPRLDHGLLARAVPASVSVAELVGVVDVSAGPSAEDFALGAAGPVRRAEFRRGRACAHEALGRLGSAAVHDAVLVGERGAPRWPDGVVGSITHCDSYAAAAVAYADDVASIGIDAEPDRPLPPKVAPRISRPDELARLPSTGAAWDRALLCAKEATYKAWYPVTGRRLRFRDVEVVIDPKSGAFCVDVLVPCPQVVGVRLASMAGQIVASSGLLVAAIVLPAPGA